MGCGRGEARFMAGSGDGMWACGWLLGAWGNKGGLVLSAREEDEDEERDTSEVEGRGGRAIGLVLSAREEDEDEDEERGTSDVEGGTIS
jgi:hypothetical protein